MKKKLLFAGLITSLFSSAQINVNQGFENTTYPGFTNVSFFRSSVVSPCVGSYGLTRNFWSGGMVGSTTYASTASTGGKLDVSFRYKTFVYNNATVNGTLKVEYSIDGGTSYQTLQTINLTSVVSCQTVAFSLPQGTVPAGSDFRFRVSGQWMSGDYNVILDEFVMTQATLGTSDLAKKETKFYPNPFKEVVHIDNAEAVKSITVSDVSGRKLKAFTEVSKEIKLSELQKGIYFLTVENKDGSKTQNRLIKE
ncbi:T9SS type A sorting domain-containing protein [Epilithonimonas sp. JDS]|uniref:T9SS type A sorting domain-containing protein n=1 Tax=Epilithonimonas sp. JDS TaxID=2902797 RepID=UPI001E3A082F|nr:T9SS type A sorting domain-containing protein [Epilithonimonas sp. JDS]MCD9853223.1 T9SS type A sorting domain-containing protein [Epilithonimonas sp. JDS]